MRIRDLLCSLAPRTWATLVGALLAAPSAALAQDNPSLAAPAIQTATNAANAGAAAGGTDHDRVLNQFALRYFGFVGAPAPLPGVPAPGVHNVGVRYWLNRSLALEGGVGIAFATSGGATQFGFALHGGIPINLAATQHLAIHVVPNLTVGLPSVDPAVLTIVAGADAVAELHFGFIGVPQMSLQARMGLNIALTNAGSTTSFAIGTTAGQGSNVWDVIAGSVSATYYFGR